MNIRMARVAIACIMLFASIVPAHALKDPNPAGYVDDLSALPGLEIYHQKQNTLEAWIKHHQLLCACGVAIGGAVFMYMVSSAFRKKVQTLLGIQTSKTDTVSNGE